MKSWQAFRKLTRALKSEWPHRRVAVRRLPIKKTIHGDCDKNGDTWMIRISRRLPEDHAMDVLVHEFAHTGAWKEWVATGEHGPEYWHQHRLCYKIYESVVEECNAYAHH